MPDDMLDETASLGPSNGSSTDKPDKPKEVAKGSAPKDQVAQTPSEPASDPKEKKPRKSLSYI